MPSPLFSCFCSCIRSHCVLHYAPPSPPSFLNRQVAFPAHLPTTWYGSLPFPSPFNTLLCQSRKISLVTQPPAFFFESPPPPTFPPPLRPALLLNKDFPPKVLNSLLGPPLVIQGRLPFLLSFFFCFFGTIGRAFLFFFSAPASRTRR